MFLVARRTKFRVVKRVDENVDPNHASSTPGTAPNDNHASVLPSTVSTVYPNSSAFMSSPQAKDNTAVSQHSSDRPPSPPTQLNDAPPASLPDFSLGSYLRMAQGIPREQVSQHSALNSWAQQLNRDGVLQTSNHSLPQHHINPRPGHRNYAPSTSTPLEPVEVPAEELNVYWEDSRKSLCSITTRTVRQAYRKQLRHQTASYPKKTTRTKTVNLNK